MSDTLTPEQARKLVDADKAARVQAAVKVVQDALQEHNCDLVAVPQIAPDGRVVAVVQLVAR